MTRLDILEAIEAERQLQEDKHPVWYPSRALAVLTEEVGEVAHALNEFDRNNLKEELIQVAAVCVRWLENMEG